MFIVEPNMVLQWHQCSLLEPLALWIFAWLSICQVCKTQLSSMIFMAVTVFGSCFDQSNTDGLFELAFGGLVYCLGVVFFKSDGVIPFAHAIWHVFVALAAAIHYYAIWKYLYRSPPLEDIRDAWAPLPLSSSSPNITTGCSKHQRLPVRPCNVYGFLTNWDQWSVCVCVCVCHSTECTFRNRCKKTAMFVFSIFISIM